MMYSEFIEGTGCRDNEHNYNLFKNLEAMYMNTNLTKDEIYEYGKKLVDNSKSPEQIELEEKLLQEIEECKESIRAHRIRIKELKWVLGA